MALPEIVVAIDKLCCICKQEITNKPICERIVNKHNCWIYNLKKLIKEEKDNVETQNSITKNRRKDIQTHSSQDQTNQCRTENHERGNKTLMARYGIYALKDTKIGFMQPWIVQNDMVAAREFKAGANAEQTNSKKD